jgi:hypothetical protein
MTDINIPDTYNENKVFENIDGLNPIKKKSLYTVSRVLNGKMSDDEFRMITMNEYSLVKTNNYKISHLKNICKFYQLKKSGNKNELIDRIYNYLKDSLYAIKIQKRIRGNVLRKYINSCGPAVKDRTLCVNDTDFASLEPIEEIPLNQFFSFTDSKNNVYGCDIVSLYGVIYKKSTSNSGKNIPLNPYTREILCDKLKSNFSLRLRLAKVNRIQHIVEEKQELVDHVKQLEFKILELFQSINELGNYADSKWFTNLSKNMTIIFIKEMYDIWNYRAQLSIDVMRELVPPHGNPFIGMNLRLAQNQSDECVRKQAVRIIELFVKSGYTDENRALGGYYVLSALTLVSEEARIALPWLFQSVAH